MSEEEGGPAGCVMPRHLPEDIDATDDATLVYALDEGGEIVSLALFKGGEDNAAVQMERAKMNMATGGGAYVREIYGWMGDVAEIYRRLAEIAPDEIDFKAVDPLQNNEEVSSQKRGDSNTN